MAMGQFVRNENVLLRKHSLKDMYDAVLREYLDLGHMIPVSTSPAPFVFYLPHHPVINFEKQTSKLREVFNASNKTSTGISINDILHVGPTLQADLVLLILRWRLFRIVFNCDITHMYRQYTHSIHHFNGFCLEILPVTPFEIANCRRSRFV